MDDALEFMKDEYKARMADVEKGVETFRIKQKDMKKMVSVPEPVVLVCHAGPGCTLREVHPGKRWQARTG